MLNGAGYFSCLSLQYEVLSVVSTQTKASIIPTATQLSFLIGFFLLFTTCIALIIAIPVTHLTTHAPLIHILSQYHYIGIQYFIGFGALCGLFPVIYMSLFSLTTLVNIYLQSTSCCFIRFKISHVISAFVACLITLLFSFSLNESEIIPMLSTGALLTQIAVNIMLLNVHYNTNKAVTEQSKENMEYTTIYKFHDVNTFSSLNFFPDNCNKEDCCEDAVYEDVRDVEDNIRINTNSYRHFLVIMSLFLFGVFVVALVSRHIEHYPIFTSTSCVLIIAIIVVLILILLQLPHISRTSQHRAPCFPVLQLIGIWISIHLLVSLNSVPYSKLALWILAGAILYIFNVCRRNYTSNNRNDDDDDNLLIDEEVDV